MGHTKETLLLILNRLFGFITFRPLQVEVILSILSGKDTVFLDKTGGGKSLTFLLPAMLFESGVTLVISPLIDLMRQFVMAGQKLNLPIRNLDGKMKESDVAATIEEVKQGKVRLLLVAPERFDTLTFRKVLASSGTKVRLVAVDEAHCASMVGHDHRPTYGRIKKHLAELGRPPVLALTATAPSAVLADLCKVLGLNDPAIFTGDLDRLNLKPQIRFFKTVAERDAEGLRLLTEASTQSGRTIGFFPTVQLVEDWHGILRGQRTDHCYVHGQLDGMTREQEVLRFVSSTSRMIIGTSAIGMGIDLPDVRRIYHVGLPYSVEDLLQQIGRAGRDGEDADCILLFTKDDLSRAERLGLGGIPSFEHIGSVLEYLHRRADEAKLKINGFPGCKVRAADYISTRADGNPILEVQLNGAFAALEEFELVERKEYQYTLKFTRAQLDADQTPLTRAAHALTVGVREKRGILLAYLVTNYAGKDSQEIYNALYSHLKGNSLTESASTWWEGCKESAYQQVLGTALMVLHHQDMTVNNGLNAYLRGKSQHRPAIHFAALAELSPRMVDWAISRLEEEGMLRRIIGPVPILALSQKGLDWVKANQGALPLALIDSRNVTQRIHHPESTEYLQRLFASWVEDAAYDAPESEFARQSFWEKRAKLFLDMRFEVEDKRMSGSQITVSFWRLAKAADVTPSLAIKMLHELFPDQVPQL